MKNNNATSSKGWRSFLTILMFLFTLLASCAAGYLVWELKFRTPEQTGPKKVEPVEVEPIYSSMNTFTVSLKPTERENDRVLYLGVSVRVPDKKALLTLEKYLPEYRSRIFMLLTKQTYEDLSTDNGKRELINNISLELSKPLAHNQKIAPSEVLINEFILR